MFLRAIDMPKLCVHCYHPDKSPIKTFHTVLSSSAIETKGIFSKWNPQLTAKVAQQVLQEAARQGSSLKPRASATSSQNFRKTCVGKALHSRTYFLSLSLSVFEMKLGAKVCAPCNRLSQLQNLTSICKHLPRAAAAAAPIQFGGGTFSSSSPGGKAALFCSNRVVSLSLICCSYAKIFAMKKISYLCLDAAKYR